MEFTRRDMIKMLGVTALGGVLTGVVTAEPGKDRAASESIPLIHTTDLYHPPQDPDDQIDLATLLALPEYDLQGVVLDITERFLHEAPRGYDIPRDPGYVPVSQMAYITGQAIPMTQGPIHPLGSPGDTAKDVSSKEQAGIEMVIDLLKENDMPVTVSVTGSPRALTAAYNREPDLLREKVKTVLLNAGSTGGPKIEWNVRLDPEAYVGLWQSDLPIDWFPPGTETGAFDPNHKRGTYWKAVHRDLFRDLPPLIRGYLTHALAGNLRGDIIRALREQGSGAVWRNILSGERHLWSTASLVMGANRVLGRTNEGWRFIPKTDAADQDIWPWRLDSICASVDKTGNVNWHEIAGNSRRRIFGRRAGKEFSTAMTEALNALLKGIT